MTHCIFCDIVSGHSEATLVWQDELVAAFLDIQPINAGHLLIVPKVHATEMADLSEDTGAHMFRIAQRLTHTLRQSGLPCEGVNLFLADGEVAGQEVFHVHLHVFPRVTGDGFGFKFGEAYFDKPTRPQLDEVGAKVRSALESQADEGSA